MAPTKRDDSNFEILYFVLCESFTDSNLHLLLFILDAFIVFLHLLFSTFDAKANDVK